MFRFLIRFLKVLAIVCIIGVGLRVIDVIFYKQKADETDNKMTSENVTADNSEENISQPIENIVITEEQKEVKQEENITIKENKEAETITIKTNETAKQETKQQEKKEIKKEKTQEQIVITQEQKEEQPPISQIVENKEEQIQQEEIKKEDVKVEEQEQVKEETKVEQEQEPVITEEYKINEQMINKIKTIIQNNETADMKNYGYEIVVDSTIPELTNEFTFTEQRVINKITWKCGIIKIYARDYYFNGNYISTQCFII